MAFPESLTAFYGLFGGGILLSSILLLAVLCFAAWIWMIVDVVKRKKFKHGDNVMWILLLVLTGIIGMILYYFMEMHKR